MANKSSIWSKPIVALPVMVLIGGTLVYELFKDKASNPRREYHFDGFIGKERVSFSEDYPLGTLEVTRPNGDRIIFNDIGNHNSYILTRVIYESEGMTNIHTKNSLFGEEMLKAAKLVQADYMSMIFSSNRARLK